MVAAYLSDWARVVRTVSKAANKISFFMVVVFMCLKI
jgi:hypothetical protein